MKYGEIGKFDLVFLRMRNFNSYVYYWQTFLGFVRDIEDNLYIVEPYYCSRDQSDLRKSVYEAYYFPELISFYEVMPDDFTMYINSVKYNLDPRMDKPRLSHKQIQVMAIYLDNYYKNQTKEKKELIYKMIDSLVDSEKIFIRKNIRVVGNIKKRMVTLSQQGMLGKDVRKDLKIPAKDFQRYVDDL